MAMVRFDPFRDLDRLQSEVNRLFEGVNNTGEPRPTSTQNPNFNRPWAPVVDVAENQNEVVLRAELPGMKQEDIDIELTGDTLMIRGERRFEDEQRRENFVRVERSYGRFQRSFTLGLPVQHDAVRATYRDGVLEVVLPKSEATRPRKVQVSSSNGGEPAPTAVSGGAVMAAGASNTDAGANR